MPFKSRWSIDIPIGSLPSYLFPAQTGDIGSKPIIIEGEKPEICLTLTTYRDWSKRLAAGLRKAGLQPGDRVLLFSGNTIFFSTVLLGTIMAGGVFSGANPTYVPRELAHQLRDSGAKFLLVGEGVLDTGLQAAKELGFNDGNVFVFDDGTAAFQCTAKGVRGCKSWTSLIASQEEGQQFRWEEFKSAQEMDRIAVLNYSSGTTGLPKGVEISHYNYVSNCVQATYIASLSNDYSEWIQRARGVAFLPMYHAYGQSYYSVNYPRMGVPMYLMRKFDFIQLLEWVQKYRVTNLALVPPIVVALTKRKEVRDYDLSSLEEVGCGAAPLAKESVVEFESRFQQRARVRQGWGMTELTCSAVGWDPRTEVIDPSAIGELMPNVEGQFVDETGQEVPDGEHGEFWCRAPNVMRGYWRRAEETKNTKTADGWLKTGDIGFRSKKDGWLHIVDRKKELIKVKGLQVAPAELEGLLLDHPEVDDAAVVGVTINGDEAPRAYIVLKESAKAGPRDIAGWVAQRVARHKRLGGGVVPVDAIPKNPSGKLLRKELRERAAKEIGDRAKPQSRL